MEFLSAHQLNIMLFMSGICGILAFLSCISRTLSPKRRRILTLLEAAAMFLLLADWYAYRFRGEPGTTGFWMVRISNFLVFFLALFMIHEITLYLSDLFLNDAKFAGFPNGSGSVRVYSGQGSDCSSFPSLPVCIIILTKRILITVGH